MLSSRLKNLRTGRNITQSDLAKRLGVARTTYAMYEQGQREPDYDTLQKIADFFEVSTDYLLGRTEKQNIEKSTKNDLTPYQRAVLDWVTSREDFSFYESPEELVDMIEQFELMYERMKKKD